MNTKIHVEPSAQTNQFGAERLRSPRAPPPPQQTAQTPFSFGNRYGSPLASVAEISIPDETMYSDPRERHQRPPSADRDRQPRIISAMKVPKLVVPEYTEDTYSHSPRNIYEDQWTGYTSCDYSGPKNFPNEVANLCHRGLEDMSAGVGGALGNICEHASDAKQALLNAIYSGPITGSQFPPCPNLSELLLCRCTSPTKIEPVPNPANSAFLNCRQCGIPGFWCCDCNRYLHTCPDCGQRLPLRKNCFLESCGLDLCSSIANGADPNPPQLLVTAVGPFRSAQQTPCACDKLSCGPCVCGEEMCTACGNLAFDAGFILGNCVSGCRKSAPPQPLPSRPLQTLFPEAFRRCMPKRRGLLCFSKCSSGQKIPPSDPVGGIVGAVEDLAAISVHAACSAAEFIAEAVDMLFPGLARSSAVSSCPNCSAGQTANFMLRYPRENGRYDPPPDPPTRPTGWRALDALNNYIDALTLKPGSGGVAHVDEEAEIPPTEVTGNKIVDTVNGVLDALCPAPPSNTMPKTYERDPAQALRTYLFERPPPLAEQRSFGQGANFRKWLPPIFSGKHHNSQGCKKRIDYVNFSILPGQNAMQHSSGSHCASPVAGH